MDAEAAIALDRLLVVRGGRPVLREVTLSVPRGSVAGLLGPNGAGKTTLMRVVVGVQRITSGSVRVLGEPAGSPALRRRVSYVTQAPAVYADLTVRENLRYFAKVLGAPAGGIPTVVHRVGLGDVESRLVGQLSGGQRARVSLATALLGRPELLVLDEPTVGLDPVLRRELWRQLRALADGGVTLLVSSHVMDEALHCDKLVLLREGELLAVTNPQELRERTGAFELEDAFLRLVESRDRAR